MLCYLIIHLFIFFKISTIQQGNGVLQLYQLQNVYKMAILRIWSAVMTEVTSLPLRIHQVIDVKRSFPGSQQVRRHRLVQRRDFQDQCRLGPSPAPAAILSIYGHNNNIG